MQSVLSDVSDVSNVSYVSDVNDVDREDLFLGLQVVHTNHDLKLRMILP